MSISPNQSYTDSPKTQEEKKIKLEEEIPYYDFEADYHCCAYSPNAEEPEVSESRMSALEEIMEALTDPNIYMMGVCRMDDKNISALLKKLKNRVKAYNLFDETEIVTVSLGKKPNLRRIQQEIADQLGFSFQQDKAAFCTFRGRYKKAVTENATQLSDRIRTKPKILFILRDLQIRLDLAELGIPFGVDHQGCKLILTSESEEILSNQMKSQRIFTF